MLLRSIFRNKNNKVHSLNVIISCQPANVMKHRFEIELTKSNRGVN